LNIANYETYRLDICFIYEKVGTDLQSNGL